ncbi:MAG: hypothetical protein ACJA2S_005505 [Cyclobacteriaceae bacterium]|jgi:hypothetical protein
MEYSFYGSYSFNEKKIGNNEYARLLQKTVIIQCQLIETCLNQSLLINSKLKTCMKLSGI